MSHEPLNPLGRAGKELWDRAWADRLWAPAQTELLQIACEQADERAALRYRVLSDQRAEDRRALRELDRLIVSNLTAIGFFGIQPMSSSPTATPDPEGW